MNILTICKSWVPVHGLCREIAMIVERSRKSMINLTQKKRKKYDMGDTLDKM